MRRRRAEPATAASATSSSRRRTPSATWLAIGLGVAAALAVATRLAPGASASRPLPRAAIPAYTTGSPTPQAKPSERRHDAPAGPHATSPLSPAATAATTGTRLVVAAVGPKTGVTASSTTLPAARTPDRPDGALDRPRASATSSARPSAEHRPMLEALRVAWSGTLTFPDDVATSYSVTVAPGTVRLRGSFTPTDSSIILTLTCPAAAHATARGGRIAALLRAQGSRCALEVGLSSAELVAGTSLRYTLTLTAWREVAAG